MFRTGRTIWTILTERTTEKNLQLAALVRKPLGKITKATKVTKVIKITKVTKIKIIKITKVTKVTKVVDWLASSH